MGITDEEVAALKHHCDGVLASTENAIEYVLLERLRLPDNCAPNVTDALLCLGHRDGYDTRLYFAQKIATKKLLAPNWANPPTHILGRVWHVYSWKVPRTMTAEQILLDHVKPLR